MQHNIIRSISLPKLARTSNPSGTRNSHAKLQSLSRKNLPTDRCLRTKLQLGWSSVWKCSWTPAGSWALLKPKSDGRTAKRVFLKNTAYVLSSSGQRIIYFVSRALSSDQIPHLITSASRVLGQSNRSSVETKMHEVFASTLQPPISARRLQEANRRSERDSWEVRAGWKSTAICRRVENVVVDRSHYVSKYSIHPKTCENQVSPRVKIKPLGLASPTDIFFFFSDLNPKPLLSIFSANVSIASA